MLVTFVLGSVHAFSVLIVPLEQALGATRAEVSLIYSFALLALVAALAVVSTRLGQPAERSAH